MTSLDVGRIGRRSFDNNGPMENLTVNLLLMIGDLPDVAPFVVVAERRSFRKAATHLGISPAAVSKAVARLEDAVGVRLLDRTTRRVAPTSEGERFLVHCRAALDALQAGRELLAEAAEVPTGLLRVSTSNVLGPLVGRVLPRIVARHPRLELQVSFSDRSVDLIDEEVDVAVRVGDLPDSSLMARRLGDSRRITAASPAYLARSGLPQHPHELVHHRCLKFVLPTGSLLEWTFRGPDGVYAVRTPCPVRMDQGNQLVEAAIAGLGVVQPLDFMVTDALSDGRLVQILADFAVPGPPIHAVWLPGRERLPAVRAFLDLLVDAFAPTPPGARGA